MKGQFQVQLFVRSDTAVGWRLLSGNNREAGRSAVWFSDEISCRTTLTELRSEVTLLRGAVRRTPPNRWSWDAHYGDRLVALAGHSFDRMIRCQQSLETFVQRLASAEVAAIVADCGARRWRNPRGEVLTPSTPPRGRPSSASSSSSVPQRCIPSGLSVSYINGGAMRAAVTASPTGTLQVSSL